MYPNTEDSYFDIDYYCNTHTPMVAKFLGDAIKHAAVEEGLSVFERSSDKPFMAVGHLYFDTLDDMHNAFEPYLDEIMGDIKNYTNVQPYFQISEVKI